MTSVTEHLYIPALPAALKHPTVFRKFDALQNGEGFILVNDHDPKPLYYQLLAERGAVFHWQYMEQGPQQWQVEIKKKEGEETVGEIAAKDMRKAEVLKKFGIDFCCGGKKTLQQACVETGVDEAEVKAALAQAPATVAQGKAFDFNRWEADFLADYIYNEHHIYYYQESPGLHELAEKVAARHGSHYPELITILSLFSKLEEELAEHFRKEEDILFPFVKALAKAKKLGDFSSIQTLPSINEAVQLMENDHEAAGSLLAAIRKAANNYQAPEHACQSFQLLYQKLEALEADLHQHVHLENNILFPKALQLQKELYR